MDIHTSFRVLWTPLRRKEDPLQIQRSPRSTSPSLSLSPILITSSEGLPRGRVLMILATSALESTKSELSWTSLGKQGATCCCGLLLLLIMCVKMCVFFSTGGLGNTRAILTLLIWGEKTLTAVIFSPRCVYVCIYDMHVCTLYMYTCIHAYMYTCMHAYMYTCIHVHIPICIHACMPICILAYMYTYLYVYMHACLYVYMHNVHIPICIHAYMCTCPYVYLHTYMPICIHAYMYTCLYVYMPICIHVYTYIHACTVGVKSNLIFPLSLFPVQNSRACLFFVC